MSTTAAHKFLQNLKYFLVNTVAWLFIVIVYGPPLFLLFLWRYFINLLATRLHSDLITCNPNDTLLVYDTPDKQPILTGGFILKVKGHIDTEKLGTLFEALFLSQQENENYQNLYCDLVKFCGYLWLLVTKMKLENHFQVKELASECDFKGIISSWFQEKFQKGLPLWQMLVLNGSSDNDGYSYFAFKAHHVLLDGDSFVHLLDKLAGVSSPDESGEWSRSESPPHNNNREKKEDDNEDDTSKDNRKSLFTELKILFSLPEVVASFTLPNVSWKDARDFPDSSPLSNFEMLPMACATSRLEPVREIRRYLGVHFPAIVYGLQGGVIRAALLDGCVNNCSTLEENLKENILISASLPVVGVEHPKNKLTNHWSGGYIKVPIKVSSAKERVLKANQSLQQMMRNEGTYIIWKHLAFMLWLIPSWVHSLLDKCQSLKLCKYRSSISCMPHSNVQYNLMGLPVQNIYHAPLMKDGFVTAVLLGCSSSHHKQIDFSLFGHPNWFPDQDKMNKTMYCYLKKELEMLATECDIDPQRLQLQVSV